MFYDCDDLVSVEIPSGVTRIGNYAFADGKNLQLQALPEKLQEIGNHAFYASQGIEVVMIPENVTRVGDFSFAYCHNLYLAIIPDTVQEMGDGVFKGSHSVTVITERDSAALNHCKDELVFFVIEPNAESDFRTTKISSTACRITEYKGTAVDVFLPETIGGLTVKEISASAFANNKKIESVSVINSVNTIGGKAFSNCTALRYVAVTDGVTNIASNAFDGCSKLSNIIVISLQ